MRLSFGHFACNDTLLHRDCLLYFYMYMFFFMSSVSERNCIRVTLITQPIRTYGIKPLIRINFSARPERKLVKLSRCPNLVRNIYIRALPVLTSRKFRCTQLNTESARFCEYVFFFFPQNFRACTVIEFTLRLRRTNSILFFKLKYRKQGRPGGEMVQRGNMGHGRNIMSNVFRQKYCFAPLARLAPGSVSPQSPLYGLLLLLSRTISMEREVQVHHTISVGFFFFCLVSGMVHARRRSKFIALHIKCGK